MSQPVALVTGSGAPRVGRAIAECLSENGYQIAVHANQSVADGQELAEALCKKQPAKFFQADLGSESESRKLVGDVLDSFGRLDVVVNSAAIWHPKPLEEVQHSDLDEYFRLNTAASFVIAQEAGMHMVKQKSGGVVINIGDWAPIRPYADYSAYFVSKGSIPTMTRMLAVEFARRNPEIRVNAILPGPVMIPDDIDPKLRSEIIAATLVQREGTPQHVAHACLFMVQNDFLTGVCLPVDGGRSIYSPYNPV